MAWKRIRRRFVMNGFVESIVLAVLYQRKICVLFGEYIFPILSSFIVSDRLAMYRNDGCLAYGGRCSPEGVYRRSLFVQKAFS